MMEYLKKHTGFIQIILAIIISGYSHLSAFTALHPSIKYGKETVRISTFSLQNSNIFFSKSTSPDKDLPLFENVDEDEIISAKKNLENVTHSTCILFAQAFGCFFSNNKISPPTCKYILCTSSNLYLTFQALKV
ncbi:MAG: hypothetical protein ABI388_06455 [Bacteroidia bacterium]